MEARRRRGESLDYHLPAMLAGTALRRRLTVIVRNEWEFCNMSVDVINPWMG